MHSKQLKPRRMFVLGFLMVILTGTALLMLPVSSAGGESLSFYDSLFMSTSAVCVTGLATIDPGTGLSMFGQGVMMVLIQVGGLGITSIGVIVIMSAGGRMSIGSQKLAKESLNLNSGKGLKSVIKSVAHVTVIFELCGAACAFAAFCGDFSAGRSVWISVFHSIAAFNNAGFDLLGDFKSLTDYHADVWLCCSTSGLIIFGGLGFFVIKELVSGKSPGKWSLHTKVVLTMTIALIVLGTLLLKVTEGGGISWLEAYFQSVSSRTAGFASISMGDLSKAGLMVIMILMFAGASPGSTGGGIKTTTMFILVNKAFSAITGRDCTAYRRQIPESVVTKAFMVFMLASAVIFCGTFLVCMMEPDFTFEQILFEVVSGFSTTGFSTGITPYLTDGSKVVISAMMFIGRVGPLTLATIWMERVRTQAVYSEEEINIG